MNGVRLAWEPSSERPQSAQAGLVSSVELLCFAYVQLVIDKAHFRATKSVDSAVVQGMKRIWPEVGQTQAGSLGGHTVAGGSWSAAYSSGAPTSSRQTLVVGAGRRRLIAGGRSAEDRRKCRAASVKRRHRASSVARELRCEKAAASGESRLAGEVGAPPADNGPAEPPTDSPHDFAQQNTRPADFYSHQPIMMNN